MTNPEFIIVRIWLWEQKLSNEVSAAVRLLLERGQTRLERCVKPFWQSVAQARPLLFALYIYSALHTVKLV